MHCYVFLSDESLLTRHHYNTLNGSGLTGLTCSKAPGFLDGRTSTCSKLSFKVASVYIHDICLQKVIC